MSAIAIIATLTVVEGQNAAFEAAFATAVAAVHANEPGCSLYTLTRSNDDHQLYRVMEVYADEAALITHGQSDHYRQLSGALKGLLAGPPTIERLSVIA